MDNEVFEKELKDGQSADALTKVFSGLNLSLQVWWALLERVVHFTLMFRSKAVLQSQKDGEIMKLCLL